MHIGSVGFCFSSVTAWVMIQWDGVFFDLSHWQCPVAFCHISWGDVVEETVCSLSLGCWSLSFGELETKHVQRF